MRQFSKSNPFVVTAMSGLCAANLTLLSALTAGQSGDNTSRIPAERSQNVVIHFPTPMLVFLLACLLQPTASRAETVPVRYPEGVSHGYLVLRTLDGKPIADGDSTQVARGDHVTSRMRFRFRDGSIYEETTVFSQHGTFRLLSDHVLQKGPTFQKPMETVIDATSGQVTVRYTDDGKEKVVTEKLDLPPDVANGILFTLLKNLQRDTRYNDGVVCGNYAKAASHTS